MQRPMQTQVQDLIGHELLGADGSRIGEIKDVYLDEQTNQPEWFAVGTGMFGSHVSFVPTSGASRDGDDFVSPFTKRQVKDAPHADPDGQLSKDEEASLYHHYGLPYSDQESASGLPQGTGADPGRGQRTDPRTDRARGQRTDPGRDQRTDAGQGPRDDAMTRSEEELRVGKQRHATGKVRLRKWVETEHETVTVPVSRERAKLTTEPITDANRDQALRGPDLTESVHEETLYAEEPVVDKRVQPKERVRLEKEAVTDDRRVDADVRKERIDTEGDIDRTPPRRQR